MSDRSDDKPTAGNQQGREARQAAGPPWEHEPDPEQKCKHCFCLASLPPKCCKCGASQGKDKQCG